MSTDNNYTLKSNNNDNKKSDQLKKVFNSQNNFFINQMCHFPPNVIFSLSIMRVHKTLIRFVCASLLLSLSHRA